MIGKTILEFRIEKKLGEGGMGAVYLARHVLLRNKLKVIKVLLPEYAANPMVRPRFHREAEAASKLEHECILGIDNFGSLDDGQLFIMVPYLHGQPLDAYLHSRGRLAPHRALHLIVQLCDALDHAHARGIIHRDLKPANVFLVATNLNPCAVKLLDFGIAKVIGEEVAGPKTRSGIAMGTPSYMSVEQFEHADEATHLADIYSLAIMIWEMVTGRLPWQHPDPAVLYHLQQTVTPERPPDSEMPPEWTEILLAALSVDPAARPQSARELAVALASALPAVGRVPSGAEILANLVPRFVEKAEPGDDTVRNASDVDRIGPLLWSPGTGPDAPHEPPPPDVQAVPNAEKPAAAHALAVAPEVNAPTEAAHMKMLPTTLSAATGVTTGPGKQRSPLWKLALATIGTAMIAAIATCGIAARVSSDDASAPTPASAPNVAPPPRAGAATTGAEFLVTEPRAPAAPPRVIPAAPARAGVDQEQEPTPATGDLQVTAPGDSLAKPARSHPPSNAHTIGTRSSQHDGPRGVQAFAPATGRRSAGVGSAVKPAGPGSGARPSANIDPNDIYGPEK